MGWTKILFRFLIALNLQQFVISCAVFNKPFGNVTEDQELEVGSSLRLRCSLFAHQAETNNVSAQNLSFKFRGTAIRNITIIDELTIEYLVPSATENDSGYYNCLLDHPDYISKQLVCSSFVAVGYKPLPVEEFSCISIAYMNLTCTWKAPQNPVDTNYTLYDYFFQPSVNRPCPEKLTASSCQFRLDTNPVYIKYHPKLHFILVGSNSLGVNKQFININHFEIVKPGVPKFNICTNITKNSLLMRWNAPKGLDNGEAPSGLVYQVKYYSVSTNLQEVKEILKYADKHLLISIENLVPNTIYEFVVRVRLNISGNEYYWSEPAKHTEKTESDVPYLAAEITESAFDTQIIAGNRSITLYWKAIPSEFENGEDFKYVISYHEHHVPVRYRRGISKFPNQWATPHNKTSYTFDHKDVDSAYLFNIIAVNKVGNATNVSTIVVDKEEKLLERPKDITVIFYGKGNYSLSWKDPNMETTHFTVYWCQTLRSPPAKCDGNIDWLHTTSTSHKLIMSDFHTNYQFAVSANQNHQTSGMAWAPCIASSGVRYKVSEMKLIPKNSTSLRVQWSLGCRATEKVIKQYLISYCPHEGKCVNNNWKCEEGWTNITVGDPSKTEYVLGSLKPYTCYFSFIRVLTDSGWGENSGYAYESTMASAPSDPPRSVFASPVPITPTLVELEVLFESPSTPNGIITKYRVYYNSSHDSSFREEEVRAEEGLEGSYQVRIRKYVHYNTNYSVEVTACVDRACSELSPIFYVYTGISNPSVVNAPRVELSDSFVNITWDPPHLPNGPVDFYEVELYNNDTEKSQHHTVNATSLLALKRVCNTVTPDESVYNIRVRAVNVEGDKFLYGEYSRPTKMVFCPSGKSVAFLVGVIAGGLVACILFIGFVMYFFHKCHTEYLARKNITIKLPLELETPFSNPLTSFDKLKNGLQKSAPDSSIPCDRAYERLCSFAQEGIQCEPEGWGPGDTPSHRNNSGESNKSGLSSADTTRTLVSMDSSGEQESDSPSHSEGIPMSNEIDPLTSSLMPQFVTQNPDNMTFSRCFVRPRMPTAPLIRCDDLGIMPSYCKFSEIPNLTSLTWDKKQAEPDSQYQSRFTPEMFLENLYKISSEPSLYDPDEPDLVSDFGTHPYSKVGLARSTTHLGDSDRPTNRNVGYSRFGTLYSPIQEQMNPQIFTVFVPPSGPIPFLQSTNKSNVPIIGKTLVNSPANISTDAYSKFGVGRPVSDSNNKNYVAFNDVREEPSIHADSRTLKPDACSSPATGRLTNAQLPDASHRVHTNGQPQEMVEEEDDPRSLLEILAADERFAVDVSAVHECPPNTTDGERPPETNHTCDINRCNGTEVFLPPLENPISNGGLSNLWEGFNGGDLPTRPLRVEDSDEEDFSSEHKIVSDNPTSNHYLPLSELAKRKIMSTNSIARTSLVDTPVASV